MENNLKDLVRQDLDKVKQKELDLKKENNSKLKEITVYKDSRVPNAKGFIDKMFEYFDNVGIKYVEKDINVYPHIRATVQQNTVPIIEVNGEYLVWQRDFQSYIQLENIIQNIATEEYVNPPLDEKIYHSIKNLNHSLNNNFKAVNQGFRMFNQKLDPIIKTLKEVLEEDETTDAKKDN